MLLTYRLFKETKSHLVARTIFFAADGVMHEAFMLNPDGDADMLAELETMIGEYISSPKAPSRRRRRAAARDRAQPVR